jgi:hypothetical protein
MFGHMQRRVLSVITFSIALLILPALCVAQQIPPRRTTAPRNSAATPSGTSAAANAAPKFKAIFEPANYPDDVSFNDVFFANDKVGWISGKGPGGFILHTADGGANWDIQTGDPHSNNPALMGLHFLDATHGWAYQSGGQLLRTTNGKSWETVGPFPAVPTQFRFVSVQDGFFISGDYTGSSVYGTRDGGRTWKKTFSCATTIQVNGLTRNTSCYLSDLFFASPKVGYAAGGDSGGTWGAIAKTTDGGASWKVIFASTDIAEMTSVFFTDENNGVVRLHDQRVLITADGGQTWRGATGTAEFTIKFADPQVGWSCIEEYGPHCSITLDGGNSWTTHDIALPEDIESYSMPRRDLVYVVGDHGMIYRYRIVPADYTAKGIVDAPLMPSYGGPIVTQLQQMQTQVAALQLQISAAGASSGSASGAPAASTGGGGFSQSAPSGGGSAQNTSAPTYSSMAPASQGTPAAGGFSQNSSSGGGFAQDTSAQSGAGSAPAPAGQDASASGGFTQDASAAGGAAPDPNATAAAGGFVQDTTAAPSSQFVQGCCGSAIQSLQTTFSAVATLVPSFSGKFRNLNMLVVGLNMLSDMMTRAKAMKDAMVALKSAQNPQAALAALAMLMTDVQGASQAVTTQFANLGAAPATGGGPGGTIGNQMGGAPATADSSATTGAPPAAAGQPTSSTTAGSQTGSAASSTASSAAGAAVNKLKKKLPF